VSNKVLDVRQVIHPISSSLIIMCIHQPVVAQANAVSDKLLDLRQCKLHGADLQGKTLSGGIFVHADISGANLREAVFSKAYAISANFSGEVRV